MKKAILKLIPLAVMILSVAFAQTVQAEEENAASNVKVIEIIEKTESTLPEIPVETDEERERLDYEEVKHVYTGTPIGKVPDELREPDPKGGKVMRMPGIDFGTNAVEDWSPFYSSPNRTDRSSFKFVDQGGGKGYHDYTVLASTGQGLYFTDIKYAVPIKPNRKYVLSILVWLDYTRLSGKEPTEVTAGVRMFTDLNEVVLSSRHGLPDYTEGWKRLEFEMSPGLHEAATYANFFLNIFNMPTNNTTGKIAIADVCLIEMPEVEPRAAYAEGEGVTFRGSAGNIDMRVVSATESDTEVVVETTGVIYRFDKVNNKIIASQKIGLKRDVSVWDVGTDLSTLSVKSATNKECIVTNPEITFGVQMDGILFLTPTKGDVSFKCTSQISGLFNRYAFGHLTVVDGYGGFTVTPDISMGSGRTSDCTVLTEGLDFVSYKFQNQLNLDKNKNPYDMNTLVSNCKAGFQILWNVRPGERLAISTFPPKEYDWEESFNSFSKMNTYTMYTDTYKDNWVPKLKINSLSLWKFSDHSYAHEYNTRYTHVLYHEHLKKNVQAAHELGIQVIEYITAYFFQDTTSADPYIKEVRRIRDTYGIDGVYSDGTPSEWRWITAYEDVRLLRELFPDGFIRVHQSGVHENGGPPLSSPSYFIPGLDAYISSVYKGETIGVVGTNPALVNVTSTQYNVSNSIGDFKGDSWWYELPDGTKEKISQDDFAILGLEWNMRSYPKTESVLTETFHPIMDKLEALWREKGDEPDFYEKYYQPMARELAKETAAKYGDFVQVNEKFDEMPENKNFGFYNLKSDIVDVSNENKALKVSGNSAANSEIIKRFSPVGGKLSVSYKLKISERGDIEQQLSSMNGSTPITLKFTSDGRICMKNKNGTYVGISRYKTSEWIDVRLELDTDKHHCSVYINGKNILHNMKTADNLYNVSELKFNIGKSCGETFLDDLLVVDKY